MDRMIAEMLRMQQIEDRHREEMHAAIDVIISGLFPVVHVIW